MRRPGPDEWRQFIAEYEQSGMMQKEFVEKYDLPFNTFQYWLYRKSKKLRSESGSTQKFLPVEVVPSPALLARAEFSAPPAVDLIELELPGVRLRFGQGTSARYVAELVGALR